MLSPQAVEVKIRYWQFYFYVNIGGSYNLIVLPLESVEDQHRKNRQR